MLRGRARGHKPRAAQRALLLLALTCSGGARAELPPLDDYAGLLADHVEASEVDGLRVALVDYQGLAQDARLARAVAAFEAFPLARLAGEADVLAFYLNAYNLFTLRLVAEHQPLTDIRDLGHWWHPVWKQTVGRLGGRKVSLDDIEHGVLRPRGEPRIHFALVCASLSCPDLRPEPYRAATLDAQLDAQVRDFLANPGKGLARDAERARVSRIFEWFEADFAATGGVRAFIARYVPLPATLALQADLPYNWRLNGRR
ncbi:MAG: DUF547 domain-containing protein [Gammaproteobacteria bacterium]